MNLRRNGELGMGVAWPSKEPGRQLREAWQRELGWQHGRDVRDGGSG